MAEAAESVDNAQPKKGRQAKKSPRIDMTPMVDLAFLLLTFFVLTSNLAKPKAMEVAVPGEGPPSPLNMAIARTLLVDGGGTVYYYSGMLKEDTKLVPLSSAKDLRVLIETENADIASDCNYLNTVFSSGKFTQENYDRLDLILVKSTQSDNPSSLIQDLNSDNYNQSVAMMKSDLSAGSMSDETCKKVGAVIRNRETAPVFVVRWGSDAKYNDVISVIDELKIGSVSKYMLAEITTPELTRLSALTGKHYPQLDQKNK